MSNALLEHVEKYLESNPIEKEIPAFSPEKMKELYEFAYYLYQDKQYQKASQVFSLLTVANPVERKYWKALGGTQQMLNEYEKAIQSYVCAQILSPGQSDPYLYIYIADCRFALDQHKEGLKMLEGAKAIAKEQNNEDVLNHVSLMMTQYKKKEVSHDRSNS